VPGALLAISALLLGNSFNLAFVVARSIGAVCRWASAIGAMVPLLAQRLHLDPALVSAPLIPTLVDAASLATHLPIANRVLGL